MNTNPLVSVIIPTYNRAAVVGRAVESVLSQTYSRIEVLIVDDGSTDDTQAVLRHYSDRVQVITQKNQGPTIARNRGIERSRGDIVAFLDSDDYWLPSKLSRQVRLLDQAGPAVPCCLCNCRVQYNNGPGTSTFKIAAMESPYSEGLWMNPAEVLITRFVMFNQAIAIRRSALDQVGVFDESLKFGEDYDLPLRLALEGPWVIIMDELTVYHVASPGSWADRALREEVRLREDFLQIRLNHARAIDEKRLGPKLRKLARRELSRARRDLRSTYLVTDRSAGAGVLGQCLRMVERLRRAGYRRSASFPRLQIRELEPTVARPETTSNWL